MLPDVQAKIHFSQLCAVASVSQALCNTAELKVGFFGSLLWAWGVELVGIRLGCGLNK